MKSRKLQITMGVSLLFYAGAVLVAALLLVAGTLTLGEAVRMLGI